MTLDEQIAAKRARFRSFDDERVQLNREIVALKRERWPHKCCRCWPDCVSDKGHCGCCDYDHVNGERPPAEDPTPEVS